jgi:hypothetical protein
MIAKRKKYRTLFCLNIHALKKNLNRINDINSGEWVIVV